MASTGQFRRENLPAPRAFYRREFGSALGKERRGWAQVKCCFHDGQSKTSLSLNMDGGGFHCFSCGAHGGDLVAFTRLRYKVDFKDAVKYLGAWDGNGSTSNSELRRIRRARAQEQAEAQAEIERQRQERLAARNWLHLLEQINRDSNVRLSEIRKGAAEKYAGESEVLWGLMADSLDLSRIAAADYAKLAGVMVVE